MLLQVVLTALGAYLLGSICFGVIVSKSAYKDDVRRHGSGNAGMTNTLRVYGGKAAVWVFIGDFLKGAAAVLVARLLAPPEAALLLGNVAAVAVVLGHLFPVFFGFRGGKGVATAAGVVLVLNPILLGVLLVPFGLILVLTRYMSLAAVTAAALLPVGALVWQLLWAPVEQENGGSVVAALVLGGLIIFMHRTNLARLKNGTESKVGGRAAK